MDFNKAIVDDWVRPPGVQLAVIVLYMRTQSNSIAHRVVGSQRDSEAILRVLAVFLHAVRNICYCYVAFLVI